MCACIAMLLSNGFSSDPRVEKEAAALTAAGHKVTVLAWDRAGGLAPRETRNGVSIERFGPRATHGAGLRNLTGYLAFWRAAADRVVELGPDAVHCHDLDTAPAGMRALKLCARRPRLVLDFHELYRESNMVPQRGAVGLVARAAVRMLERRALGNADRVLVANPGTLDYYRSLGAADKLVTIENAPDARMFHPASGSRPDRRFTIGFMGQKRYLAGLLTLIDVVRHDERLAAILAGGGTAADDVAQAASGIARIRVSGPFSYTELPDLYAACDAVHAVYDTDLGNVRTLFPVKMMEAMACALPVIVAEGTWAGEYAVRHGIGLAVGEGAASLEQAIARLVDGPSLAAEMGRRGREIVEAGLNWSSVSERLVDTYAGIIS